MLLEAFIWAVAVPQDCVLAMVLSNTEVYWRDSLVSAALNGRRDGRGMLGWGCGLVQTMCKEGACLYLEGRFMQITPIVASPRELNLNSLSKPNFTSRGRWGTRLYSSFCELVVQGGPVYIYYPGKLFYEPWDLENSSCKKLIKPTANEIQWIKCLCCLLPLVFCSPL